MPYGSTSSRRCPETNPGDLAPTSRSRIINECNPLQGYEDWSSPTRRCCLSRQTGALAGESFTDALQSESVTRRMPPLLGHRRTRTHQRRGAVGRRPRWGTPLFVCSVLDSRRDQFVRLDADRGGAARAGGPATRCDTLAGGVSTGIGKRALRIASACRPEARGAWLALAAPHDVDQEKSCAAKAMQLGCSVVRDRGESRQGV